MFGTSVAATAMNYLAELPELKLPRNYLPESSKLPVRLRYRKSVHSRHLHRRNTRCARCDRIRRQNRRKSNIPVCRIRVRV